MNKKRDKKGQITLFVILGLVILIIIIIFLVASIDKKSVPINENYAGALKNHVDNCVGLVAKEAIYELGLHGGYINAQADPYYGEPGTSEYVDFDGVKIPVILNEHNQYSLSLDEINKRLSRKICLDLPACLDFSYFREAGLEIIEPSWEGDLDMIDDNCKVRVKDKSVLIQINYPISLRKENSIADISSFAADIPLGFGGSYKSSLFLITKIINTGLSNEYNISDDCSYYDINGFTNVYLKGDNKIIQIVDFEPSSLVKNIMPTPFIFQFAVKDYDVAGKCVG